MVLPSTVYFGTMQYQCQSLINNCYLLETTERMNTKQISQEAKPMEQKLTERGQQILDAAQQLFFQHGYDETSLAMIIDESGGSRRSIYSEFGNKQGLLLAVVKRQVIIQANTLASIDTDLSTEQTLNDVCFRFVQGMFSKTIRALFRLVVQQSVNMPELGELIYQSGPMTGVKPLSQYLQALVDRKQLQLSDSHYSARMLLEMCKGPLQTTALLLPNAPISDEDIRKQVAFAVDIFIKAHQVKAD